MYLSWTKKSENFKHIFEYVILSFNVEFTSRYIKKKTHFFYHYENKYVMT